MKASEIKELKGELLQATVDRSRLTAENNELRQMLDKHLNGARNYEEWSRLQLFDKDRKIEALLERIDYLTNLIVEGLATPRKSD